MKAIKVIDGLYSKNNRGSATVEASIIIPIMLFFFAILYHWGQLILVENIIYEAGAETAKYISEYSFFTDSVGEEQANIILGTPVIEEYIDDIEGVEKYIKRGVSGLDFSESYTLDGEITLILEYETKVWVPFFTEQISKRREVYVVKKFTGRDVKEQDEDVDPYVYVSDYESVYHTKRDCTHLLLSISLTGIGNVDKYSPCDFCGNDIGKESINKAVFITNQGDKYHSTIGCSGLKRTVTRKRLSEAEGVTECSRCGMKN